MDEERAPNHRERAPIRAIGRVRRAEPSTRTSNRFSKRRDAFRAKVGTLDIGTNSNAE